MANKTTTIKASEKTAQVLKIMKELKEIKKENTILKFKNDELTKQLTLGGVSSSLTSKEAIDYEIYAKRKDKEENLKSWLYAMFFGIMFFVGLFAILKSCSS